MFNKKGFRFLILVFCAVLVLPFVAVGSIAKADGLFVKGVEKLYVFSASDEVVEGDFDSIKAAGSEVKITVRAADRDAESLTDDDVIYENSVYDTTTTGYTNYFTSFTYTYSSAQIKFVTKADEDFIIRISHVDGEVENAVEKLFAVATEIPEDAVVYDLSDIENYRIKIAEYTKNFVEGDKFSESSFNSDLTIDGTTYSQTIEKLFVFKILNYKNTGVKKVVHYAAPTSSWSTTSATGTTNFSFSVSKAGTYKFYITVETDKFLNDQNIKLSDDGLEEKDGYLCKVFVDGEEVYAVSGEVSYTYYTDSTKEEKVDTEGKEVTFVNVIPVFEFTVGTKGFSLEAPTTSQENGYIGSSYSMKGSFTTEGTSVNTTYKLYYSATTDSWNENKEGWTESELELSSSLAFTPDAKGYYLIEATAVDIYGNSATAVSGVIVVNEEFKKIEFVTSFGDWIKANTLPFIFLCVAAACLIAIVLLLVIKPKEKEVEVTEEDK